MGPQKLAHKLLASGLDSAELNNARQMSMTSGKVSDDRILHFDSLPRRQTFMTNRSRLGIVGSGASAIFLLKHIFDNAALLRSELQSIDVFEQRREVGTGMPYNRRTTDHYNICNISSAEIPALSHSLVDWLASLSERELGDHGLQRKDIGDDEMYRRTTLGDYFQSQFQSLTDELRSVGITVRTHAACAVKDIVDSAERDSVELRFDDGESIVVDRVVIATGHSFSETDQPESGYFASPWPMHKLIPADGQVYNFEIGTLGASLSAFDVVASMSHRHGEFEQTSEGMKFIPKPGTQQFRMVLHSAEGWLPHLQYEQEEAFREIYRHVDRDTMLGMRAEGGFLSLDNYFDLVCRPALITAFSKDGRDDIVKYLQQDGWGVEQFVQQMSEEHSSDDPFALMRAEMPAADRSLRRGIPIHWKEVLDDLMFTLNFHFDWLPAEDHLRYRKVIVPFLMNVIAAMPLCSAQTLLALHDAGKLDVVAGRVTVKEKHAGETEVEVESAGAKSKRSYRMFIDCSGQGALDIEKYPFPSMIKAGTVSEAIARFRDLSAVSDSGSEHLTYSDGKPSMRLGGIAIDGYYRVVGDDGESNPRIYDVAFPHATGVRPYSYGLQACDTTAAIVVESWCDEVHRKSAPANDDATITQTYADLPAVN